MKSDEVDLNKNFINIIDISQIDKYVNINNKK